MKKIISVMLCLAMLITPLASMAEVTYPISDTPITLTYWMPLNGGAAKYITSYDENTAYAQMQLDTGVDIEWKHPAVGQEQEAFNMMLLSKELPDLIAMANKYTGGEHQGVRDGIFVDLTPYLEEYAPDYWALLQSNEEFRRTVTDENGMIAAFCTYKEPGDPNAMRLVLQDSVMKELGAEVPLTIADWDALFEKMLAKGITPYLLDANGQSKLFMGAFDTYPGFYVKDGQVQYGFMNEGFRAYLKQMNEWYQKGYISKDFTSIDGNTANTMFDSGTDTLEDMIASISRGYLLEGMKSGMEDPKHWGIQCIIERGYEIIDGKLTGKVVSPLVMTGYVPDLLGYVSMVSRDREVFGSGACGKGHKEWVKVADGGPYLKAKARLG